MGGGEDNPSHHSRRNQHRQVFFHTTLRAFIKDKTVDPPPRAAANHPRRNRRDLGFGLEVEETLEAVVGQVHFDRPLDALFQLCHPLPERLVIPTDGAQSEVVIPDLSDAAADRRHAKLKREHCLE
jgi:hypothetical protein